MTNHRTRLCWLYRSNEPAVAVQTSTSREAWEHCCCWGPVLDRRGNPILEPIRDRIYTAALDDLTSGFPAAWGDFDPDGDQVWGEMSPPESEGVNYQPHGRWW